MRYIMDSNTFMEPHRIYYPFDLFPTFWNYIKTYSEKGIVTVNLQVASEISSESIEENKDELQKWFETDFKGEILKVSNDVVNVWTEILQYIYNSPLYNEKAFDAWSIDTVADPWIIATAKANELVVVSNEQPNTNLRIGSPTKEIKIPDVCSVFDVECITLQEMLRRLQFSV